MAITQKEYRGGVDSSRGSLGYIVKQILYMAGGSTSFTWNMLQDLLLDVEVGGVKQPTRQLR